MRERENWDVLCEVCDKTIEYGIATESGDNYCNSCYNKLVYGNKDCKCQPKHVHFRLFKDVQNHSFSLVK